MAQQILLDTLSTQSIETPAKKNFRGRNTLQLWGRSLLFLFPCDDRNILSPPGSPADGMKILLPAAGTLTGAFAGMTHESIASYEDGAWTEIAPVAGDMADILDENIPVRYDGAHWRELIKQVRPVSGDGTADIVVPAHIVNKAHIVAFYEGGVLNPSLISSIAADTPAVNQTTITFTFTVPSGTPVLVYA